MSKTIRQCSIYEVVNHDCPVDRLYIIANSHEEATAILKEKQKSDDPWPIEGASWVINPQCAETPGIWGQALYVDETSE
jgi:hypothetical protein